MFIRTRRLFLRPAWREDARAVASEIGQWAIVSQLSRVPWPYTLADAQNHIAHDSAVDGARFLMFARTSGQPTLVGGIAFGRQPETADVPELSYWIARDHWGRGYATEAGHAVLEIAFEGLRLPRLAAGHFIDNPASGRVLEKLGFTPTGKIIARPCLSRGREVDLVEHRLTREAWQAQRQMHDAPRSLARLFSIPPMQSDLVAAHP